MPAHLRAQVDALAGKKTGSRSRNLEAKIQKPVASSQYSEVRGHRRRQPNKTEATYRTEVLGQRGDLAAVHYEGLTVRMANGHRYTPDWVVVTVGGGIECHEVKGGYALNSQQRARLAFDQVRVEFPWVAWTWATRTKDGWRIGG